MENKKMLSIGDASRYLGISRDTLRRWEKKGKIKPLRSPTNRRYYTKEQLEKIITRSSEVEIPSKKETKGSQLLKLILLGIVGFALAAIIISIIQIFLMQ